MPLIRWNPWNLQSAFDDDWDLPTIPGLSRIVGQGLNIYETDSALVAEAALPGIAEDQIDITVDDGIVRVTATSSQNQEEKDKRRYFMSSMSNSFNYSFRLPEGVVTGSEPACELENGVLTMTFPKVQKTPPKKLKVVAKRKGA